MSEELQYTAFQSRYRDKQYIGAGGFGKVYKVFDHAKNHYVALKVSDVRPEWNKFTLKNEVELVNKLNFHRNIARYDACYRFNTGITGEMDFALLQFYEDGNLEQFLKKSQLSQEDKRLIIGGILNGISFLHENNIIHRDLKAENILMSREDGVWTPKITDFGLSREVSSSVNITNSAVGISYAYAAPEQILNQKIYRNVDIWAVGVIIYRIIADELPFIDNQKIDKKSVNTQLEISKKITSNKLPEKLETLEEPFRSIIKRCLVNNPLERAQKASELIALLKGVQAFDSTSSYNPKAPRPAPEDESVDSTNDKTVFNPRPSEPKQDTTPEVDEPAPTPLEYEMPNQNQTQFIPQPPKSSEESPDIETDAGENEISASPVGDRKKNNRVPLIVASLILILLLAGGAWWYFGDSNEATNSQKAKTGVAFIPNDKETSPLSTNNYVELEREIKKFSNDPDRLDQIENELLDLAQNPSNVDNYRPYYLLALNQSINSKSPRDILESLRESATIAVNNNAESQLLKDMEEEKNKGFDKISKLRKGKSWNEIVNQLENFK